MSRSGGGAPLGRRPCPKDPADPPKKKGRQSFPFDVRSDVHIKNEVPTPRISGVPNGGPSGSSYKHRRQRRNLASEHVYNDILHLLHRGREVGDQLSWLGIETDHH